MWSWKLDDVKRNGMSTQQWVRYHLMRLQLRGDLTHIMRGGHRYPIAPGEELRALLPELQPVERSEGGLNRINASIPPPKQPPGGGPGECCCLLIDSEF